MIANKVVHGGDMAPLTIPPYISLGKYIFEKIKSNIAREDKIILTNSDRPPGNTSKQILQQIANLSSGLKKLGVNRGDVVAICSENRNEYIVAVIAILCCGATVTTINILYIKDEIENALNISKPAIVMCSESFLKQHIDSFKSASRIKHIIQFNGSVIETSVISYESIMVYNTDVNTFEATNVDGKADVAFIMYSSGTTGIPKGVILTHENVLHGILILNTGFRKESKSRVMSVMPWYHVYGLLTTIEFIINDNLVVYLSEFNPNKYFAAIQEYEIDVLLTVPRIIVLLAKCPLAEINDLSSVQFVWCASAPLSENIVAQALEHLPNCKGIFQAYGLTESTLVIIKNWHNLRASANKLGCCGIPLPGLKLKVVDVINRHKLEANQEGEICVKGPMLTKGYLGNEAATKDLFDEEGYLKTGDIGYYDEDGCIFIVDRLKEIIKYKGHQVPPSCIESVLLQHNEVAECAVIGAPDEVAGELPTAFVVPKPGKDPSESELIDFTNSRLSLLNRIRGGIIFVNEIPKNASGKVIRRELKKKLENMQRQKYI